MISKDISFQIGKIGYIFPGNFLIDTVAHTNVGEVRAIIMIICVSNLGNHRD